MATRVFFAVALAMCLTAGCGSSGDGVDDLNDAVDGTLPDSDRDGLFDIAPPLSVPFDLDATLGATITSTVTLAEAQAAANVSVSDLIASTAIAELTLLVTYEDGTTQTLRGEFPIEPFELNAEIACPVSVRAEATVTAALPLLGRQTVASFAPVTVDRDALGGGFECGSVFDVLIFMNDRTGLVDATITGE